jgi:hypothetical protein
MKYQLCYSADLKHVSRITFLEGKDIDTKKLYVASFYPLADAKQYE